MKLQVEIDGSSCMLDLQPADGALAYRLEGAANAQGDASVVHVSPGVYSVLLGNRSQTVRIVVLGDTTEVWIGHERHVVSLGDARDRSNRTRKASLAGPQEIRAQMPGKIIQLLVAPGASVVAGQGLVVIEAMKMQNELKSPKDGQVTRVHITEGAAVAAGDRLMVIE